MERDQHIRQLSCSSCSPSSHTLDGITDSQREKLEKKSASNASPEAQWFAVFDILFPGHDHPESPYIDNELLQDITLYQDFLTSNGPRILSNILTQQGVVTWNLPNEERDLAALQQTVFEEGLRTIFDQWVARSTSASSNDDANIHSSSGIADNRSGAPTPGMRSTLLGRGSTNILAGSEAVQENSSDQNLFTGTLNEFLDYGQDGLEFHEGVWYEGQDEELMRSMLGSQASSSFQPAPG
ncbi:hypothetical protein KVR01_010618 [Diaporthe batatas]|uniref:uncharacterized protein n=1 Tax=Diaporthe batatas TaxID=748121 RepID=UPI001D0568C6|nr:uncharacterized protein KVR01_010618 [Diaporthe batatas]KAG8159981.1 hypothetical protein KVR01_010618 [Diaporthe batatas]